jgi:HEAT repeat protein
MSLYLLARDGDADALRDRLWDSDSPAVRRRAAELLGDVGDDDPEVVDALVRAAKEDDDRAVRAAAVDGLDALGTEHVERLIADLAGVDLDGANWQTARAFMQALGADRAELRMAAATGLGGIGERKAVSPLVDRLGDDDPRVRVNAATALGRLGYPEATEGLAALLSADHDATRQAAADALATIGSEEALSVLLGRVDDPDESIRRTAVASLGNAESAEPVSALVEALSDESRLVRTAAVFSIIELLSNVPAERSHEVRESVVDHLRASDDEAVIEPLVDILTESVESGPRRNAAWLLGRVADGTPDDVVDPLVDCLDDDDRQTAQFATTSLRELGGSTVERRLLGFLNETSSASARAQAVFVLGSVGGDDARERLRTMVGDGSDVDEEVRRRAFSALSKLGGTAPSGAAPGVEGDAT